MTEWIWLFQEVLRLIPLMASLSNLGSERP